ncbi:MAG: hypothetical protein L0Z07_07140, partial [Planctomycetes bacterium]|nr:hypothetical protein [Planctomycetota bacterium]
MTDHESHFEFNNELLNAYLDDELTPDERASVEKRLAADPSARRMLDELRAVSLAVRSLPAEAVGEDLCASILQRAERAMVTNPPAKPATSEARFPRLAESAELASQPTGSMLPKWTIGRTGRGWFWAGLAVAAALLISFFQPEAGRDQKLPDIARRSPARRDEMHIGNAEMRALEPAPSNTDLAEAAPATVPPDNYEAAAAARPAAPASGSTPPVSAHGDSSGFAAGSADRALALHDKSADGATRERGRLGIAAEHDEAVSR